MAIVLQVPSHLLDPIKWRLEELLVDLHHEVEVQGRLAHQFVIE